jgi:hypothetical protein
MAVDWARLGASRPGIGQVVFPAVETAQPVINATLMKDPPPDPKPLSLVPVPPPGEQAAAPSPAPAVAPSAAAVGGANLGALGAQGRKIGQIGAEGLEAAQSAGQELRSANDARKQAAYDVGEVQRQKAEAEAGGYDAQFEAAQRHQTRMDEIRRGEEEAVGSAKKGYDDALQDAKYAGISRERRNELQAIASNRDATPVQQAAAKAELDKASRIDPDQYLGGSTARKIGVTIAQALGAFGAGMTGGPNHAMQIIRDAIQKNIEAQQANFAKREREAEKAGARVGETRAGFEQDRQQALRDYGIGLEMVKMKVARQTAGLEGTEAAAKANDLMAQLDAEVAKNASALEASARGQYLDAEIAKSRVMGDQAQMQEQRAARSAAGAPAAKPMPEGGIKTLADAQRAVERVSQLRQDFKNKTGKFSFLAKYVPGTDADVYENARKLVAQEFTNALSGTGASNEEREQILSTFPRAETPNEKADQMFNQLTARVVAVYNSTKNQHRAQGYHAPDLPQQSAAPSSRRSERPLGQ